MSEKDQKKIDVEQVTTYLSRSFAMALQKATSTLGTKDISRGTVLYDYQVEFCYLIDDIQRGPSYIVPKLITQANELIDQLAAIEKSAETSSETN